MKWSKYNAYFIISMQGNWKKEKIQSEKDHYVFTITMIVHVFCLWYSADPLIKVYSMGIIIV